MSLSVLDQYLRVVPTLGVQASQTQYVNNLRAGYSSSTSSNVSQLNLFSVDGADTAMVNIVSKTATRLFGGDVQNAMDYAVAGTVASTQYAEFQVNSSAATLHVPELSGSVLRLGAAGAANASTMTYVTISNDLNGEGAAFSKVSTTTNYLELTSSTPANTVIIAGDSGVRVEADGTNAVVSARTGDLTMQASTAGARVVTSANAGISMTTEQGDFSLAAPAGAFNIDARDLVSMESTQGDVVIGAVLGNTTLAAAQTLSGTANVISLSAVSVLELESADDLSLTTTGDLLATVGGNTTFATVGAFQSNAASITLGSTGPTTLASAGPMRMEGQDTIEMIATGLIDLASQSNVSLTGTNMLADFSNNISMVAAQEMAVTSTSGNVAIDATAGSLNLSAFVDAAMTSAGTMSLTAATTYALQAASISETASTGDITVAATAGSLIETAGNAVSVTAQTGTMTLSASKTVSVTSTTESLALSAAVGSITGTASNLTWTSTDSGSPFVVTQKNGALQVGGTMLSGLGSNVHLYVEGDSVFYGNVDIRGEINRVVTNEVILEVKDKVILLSNTNEDENPAITNFDQNNSGIQLKTPTDESQFDHSKYIKWFSSGSGASEAGYLKAMGIMDTTVDGSRWVVRGGDLWLERTFEDAPGSTKTVAFGFVITKDSRLALVRRQGAYTRATELGPATGADMIEPMQFFGTPITSGEIGL